MEVSFNILNPMAKNKHSQSEENTSALEKPQKKLQPFFFSREGRTIHAETLEEAQAVLSKGKTKTE